MTEQPPSSPPTPPAPPYPSPSPIDRLIRFCLEQKLVVFLSLLLIVAGGVYVAPFDWDVPGIDRDPVPVDAIPDIGENQQIVFTEWPGRSPQDVEDQVTYPLATALQGVPGVRTIRSSSDFGFSSIYVIFNDGVEFYWSRSRLLEKLASLAPGLLPEGVQPRLGPDATALGQIFWYTLEGRDQEGRPTGGWDLHELRTAQDWTVRFALQSAEGVAEVASVGGFVQEYQIDADPDAMRAYGVTLGQVFAGIERGNIDVGAGTIAVNGVDYVIRGRGFITGVADIEEIVLTASAGAPVRIRDVARVSLGPAMRRGALDKGGAEAVGGVVVARHGSNPLEVIENVKARIEEIAPGLPSKTLADGTVSRIAVVPFYDRSGLIAETLGTLNRALLEQSIVTVIVVIAMLMHLRASLLVSSMLPLAILLSFIGMKLAGVDANIVALSGIAIAIGEVCDMGIVLCENILRRLDEADPEESRLEVIYRASTEVGSAVFTAVATTVVSFLPVFAMQGAEGKLFTPLAYTKTFALIASVVLALTVLPPLAHALFAIRIDRAWPRRLVLGALLIAGLLIAALLNVWAGLLVCLVAAFHLARPALPGRVARLSGRAMNLIAIGAVLVVLTGSWLPLGPEQGFGRNLALVGVLVIGILLFFGLVELVYSRVLRWCLDHKIAFLLIPSALVLLGATAWLGFERTLGWLPASVRSREPVVAFAHAFPGLGKEFMPTLDEGSFLYMPTTMPHASLGESLDALQKLDMAIAAIPEIDSVVGKLGRAESALDPAPMSMFETVVNYKPEYATDPDGRPLEFRFDPETGEHLRDAQGRLIPAGDDERGKPYRHWRPHIRGPGDIWAEIVAVAKLPGTTSAPELQPIAARLVMLQTGLRAAMGVKIKGPDLETIDRVALDIERLLKQVPAVEPATVIADRIVGTPYLEIEIDRARIARYGLSVRDVQDVVEVAIGGMPITTTVEGRQRFPVRVRYPRELRDSIEALGRILVPAGGGGGGGMGELDEMDAPGASPAQIPLTELATINFVRGPQMIKSEDAFLLGYVLFDKKPGLAEVSVVEQADAYLKSKIGAGELVIPAGVSYAFTGTYENQVRSERRLMVVIPVALLLIFLIMYLQFSSVLTTALVFTGIPVAFAGGMLLLWLYAQPWFLDFSVFGQNARTLFQVGPLNLSVAVWVGFLSLFGIACDDGVIIATYLDQSFVAARPTTVRGVREATVAAGRRRARPCLMTVATTILALLPVLTSTGRGSEIILPMAIPVFGGMLIVIITMFVVPTLYCAVREGSLRLRGGPAAGGAGGTGEQITS